MNKFDQLFKQLISEARFENEIDYYTWRLWRIN